MKCFWCIDEILEAAINRVTCPLRYKPPQEFCKYEVNEEPGGGEEASMTYSINENVPEKLSGKKVITTHMVIFAPRGAIWLLS